MLRKVEDKNNLRERDKRKRENEGERAKSILKILFLLITFFCIISVK